MTDGELIGYCDLHCESQRALFKGVHINRMLALAGNPDDFVQKVPDEEWISVHEPMKELCRLARQRMAANAKSEGADAALSRTLPLD